MSVLVRKLLATVIPSSPPSAGTFIHHWQSSMAWQARSQVRSHLLVGAASGNTSTGILIGMQIAPESDDQFRAAEAALGEDYSFAELAGDARQVFDMFIS